MPTNMKYIIEVTDEAGNLMLDEDQSHEPHPASVVLVNGPTGTAWQRYFSDGLWHSVRGGRGRTWTEMLERQRNMILIFDAPKED